MAYRMKRNGAGLASVCILATMVLVMISSTTSLYFGTEGSLMARYPWELMVEYRFESVEDLAPQNVSELRGEIDTILEEQSCTPQNVSEWRALAISGYLEGSRGDFARADESGGFYTPKGEICNFYFIPQEDYNARTGETVALQPGEALVYDSRGTGYSHSELDLGYGLHYDIVGQALPWKCGSIAMDIAPTLVLPSMAWRRWGSIPRAGGTTALIRGCPPKSRRRSATACTMPTSGCMMTIPKPMASAPVPLSAAP